MADLNDNHLTPRSIFPFIPGCSPTSDFRIMQMLEQIASVMRGLHPHGGREARRARAHKVRYGHRLLSQLDPMAMQLAKESAYDRREVYMHRAARERLKSAQAKRVAR